MAEAADPSLDTYNYFCHSCNTEITPKLPEYVCPRCENGFIELIERTEATDSDTSSDSEFSLMDFLSDSINRTYSSAHDQLNSTIGPRRSQRLRRTQPTPRHGRVHVRGQRQATLAPILQEFLMQVTSGGFENLGPAEMGLLAGGLEVPTIPMFVTSTLASNPGDYAWGRAGLDTIITQLMNQFEGSGPAPLSAEKISQIPTVKVTQEQCDKSLQCSICMEEYALGDPVRKLNCEHCYHEHCILPWLQLHATCPVCRKLLNSERATQPRASQSNSVNTSESTNSAAPTPQVVIRTTPNGQFVTTPNPTLFREEDLD